MPRRRKPAGRRERGTGYTTQAKNGTYTAYYPNRADGGYHVRRGFATQAAAEAWLDSFVVRHKAREDVDSGQQRVATWAEKWIERAARERQWKAKMKADVLFKLSYANAYLGDMPLADVFPDHVDAMMDELARDLAETTVRQIRNYLFQVFEAAVKRRYITFNPVIKPERHKRAKQKEPERLSAPQAALLVLRSADSFYALAWWLILVLGLRAGEVCGLRWGDVDLERAILHIEQEVTDLRGVAWKDMPKGDKKRTLPFPRALVPYFKLHRAWYTRRAAQGVKRGYWEEHGLVFPGRSGKPMNTTSLRHQLKRMTDGLRLPPVTTHMLRHTAGAFYTNLKTPQEIVSPILGHTPNITGHYAPPDVETLREWVERVYRQLAGEVERGRNAKVS
jgi:integrase